MVLDSVATGSLATLTADGAPFASLVLTATDEAGDVILLLSRLAAHTRNLECDPRASLLAIAAGGETGDPLAGARVTVLGRAERTSSLEYADAVITQRTRIHHAFADVFRDHDVLVWPTTSTPAHPHPGLHGYPEEIAGRRVPDPQLENQMLTEAIAHAGYPAISIPAGFTADGLPVGLQIAAGHGQDAVVLRAAGAVERAFPWSQHRPPLSDGLR